MILLIIPIQFVEISLRIFGPSAGLPVAARRHYILNVGSYPQASERGATAGRDGVQL
jgi:hypothetical protein